MTPGPWAVPMPDLPADILGGSGVMAICAAVEPWYTSLSLEGFGMVLLASPMPVAIDIGAACDEMGHPGQDAALARALPTSGIGDPPAAWAAVARSQIDPGEGAAGGVGWTACVTVFHHGARSSRTRPYMAVGGRGVWTGMWERSMGTAALDCAGARVVAAARALQRDGLAAAVAVASGHPSGRPRRMA